MSDKQAKRLEAFRGVAEERVVRMNLGWIQFEQGELAALNELLREAHTLKGECSLMGFASVGGLIHAVEDALAPLREGGIPDASGQLGDDVLDAFDHVLVAIAGESGPLAPEVLALQARLSGESTGPQSETPESTAVASTLTVSEKSQATPTPSQAAPEAHKAPNNTNGGKPGNGSKSGAAGRQVDRIRVTADKLDRMRDAVGELLLARIRLSASATELRKARELLESYQASISADNAEAARLSTTMIELLGGIEVRLSQDDFNLDRLITELEATSRELRMVPLGTLFEKYPRAVRTLAKKLNKSVRLEMAGENLEIDRAVLEHLDEPLLHLVRNAVDHGLESSKDRVAAGKSEVGVLSLTADVEGRTLRIVVADDGGGIDPAGVRGRAVELGIVNAEEAAVMEDQELLRLLFASGMSTRRNVTQVSGRGIGLDVVQTHMESVGGAVMVTTSHGQGTAFELTVPITVAISSVLLMRIGRGRYALAARSVVTVVDAHHFPVIDTIHGPSVRFEERLIPILAVDELLGETGTELVGNVQVRLVILRTAGGMAALSGTTEHIEREAVMKAAGPVLDRDPVVRAVVPLEDGSLALVLKASELLGAALRGGRMEVGPTAVQLKTVVVADDSPVIRDLVAEALRSHGLRVLEAADGLEALELVEEHPDVDLVVTDVEMPRMDGVGLITELRKRPGRRIPAVVVSMRGSDSDKAKAVAAGADAYLVKTDFSHQGLWAMVGRFLE